MRKVSRAQRPEDWPRALLAVACDLAQDLEDLRLEARDNYYLGLREAELPEEP